MTVSQAKARGARYKVHRGYTAKGKDRWVFFATLVGALDFLEAVHARTGVIMTVIDIDHA